MAIVLGLVTAAVLTPIFPVLSILIGVGVGVWAYGSEEWSQDKQHVMTKHSCPRCGSPGHYDMGFKCAKCGMSL